MLFTRRRYGQQKQQHGLTILLWGFYDIRICSSHDNTVFFLEPTQTLKHLHISFQVTGQSYTMFDLQSSWRPLCLWLHILMGITLTCL